MDTFDYLFCKSRENGKVAKALSEKLQTEVDKNKIVDEIGNIDVGAIVQANIKRAIGTQDFYDLKNNDISITDSQYANDLLITSVDCLLTTNVGLKAFYNCISLSNVKLPAATSISDYVFYACVSLKKLDLPCATNIMRYLCYYCISLSELNAPNAENIYGYAFNFCCNLKDVNISKVKSIGAGAFKYCILLQKIIMPSVTSISENAFDSCLLLKDVILKSSSIVNLLNANAFQNNPIAKGTGYIYVLDELVDSYKTATNWSVYAEQIRPMSEYVEE